VNIKFTYIIFRIEAIYIIKVIIFLAITHAYIRCTYMSKHTTKAKVTKWGNYKIDKKNSWAVGLDYYDQAKNAPIFKTQKYESNDLQKTTRLLLH